MRSMRGRSVLCVRCTRLRVISWRSGRIIGVWPSRVRKACVILTMCMRHRTRIWIRHCYNMITVRIRPPFLVRQAPQTLNSAETYFRMQLKKLQLIGLPWKSLKATRCEFMVDTCLSLSPRKREVAGMSAQLLVWKVEVVDMWARMSGLNSARSVMRQTRRRMSRRTVSQLPR